MSRISNYTQKRRGTLSKYIWDYFKVGMIHSFALFAICLFSFRMAVIASGIVIGGMVVVTILMNATGMTLKTKGTSAGWLPMAFFIIFGEFMDHNALSQFLIILGVFLLWCVLYFTPLYRFSFPIMYRMAWE